MADTPIPSPLARDGAAVAPDGMPVLGVGRHQSPADGACLMEYVSLLAGERFRDHPRSTAPTLGCLARLVNDATSDAARQQLVVLAPELAALPRLEPHHAATVVADVLDTAAAALERLPAGPGRTPRTLRRQAGRERRRAAAPDRWWTRSTDVLHREGLARLRMEYAVRSLAALPVPERDDVLTGLVRSSVVTASAVSGRSATQRVRLLPQMGQAPVP